MPKVFNVTFNANIYRKFRVVACKGTEGQERRGHATVRNSIKHT